MNAPQSRTIYTVGHSTHSWDAFLAMLQSFLIKTLVDIRRLPGSRKFPQFDKENLEVALPLNGIRYVHLKELGGRRKPQRGSKNTLWRNASFRGYADYMETDGFKKGIEVLKKTAMQSTTVYMCAEAVWWRCHRSLISDYLKAQGWTVLHIMGKNKSDEHRYTPPARLVGDHVFYSDED